MAKTTERGERVTSPEDPGLNPTIEHPPNAQPLEQGAAATVDAPDEKKSRTTVDIAPPPEVAIRQAAESTLDPHKLPSETSDTPVGDTLGRYKVVGRLGVGGMGEVLKVVDPAIGREVAAKVILGEATRDQLERFALEAQVTGQLEHPNIVPVHEFGQTPGNKLYFTMKRVDGVGLDELIEDVREGRRELPLAERIQILIKVCDAVAFAHSHGVIHRDLKPANVMVGRFGEVQLMDWGLAKIIDQPDRVADRLRPSMEDTMSGVTMDGAVKGTPAYMPPEQAQGEVDLIDERSDVYSLGALLYEMLTLSPPYQGDVMQVLELVAEGVLIPPSHCSPDVPWELEALVLKAMAHDPEARYPSAEALRDDLSGYLGGQLVSAAHYSTSQWFRKLIGRNRAAAAVVMAVGLVGALALVALQWQKRDARLKELAAKQKRIDLIVAKVDAQLKKVSAEELAKAFDAAATDGPPPRSRWRQTLAGLLRVASAVDRGLTLDPRSSDLRARRRAATERLLRAATLSGDFTLAAQAASDLERFDATPEQVQRLREQIVQARTARLRQRRDAVQQLIDDAPRLDDPSRNHPTWTFDDYVFSAVGYRDAQTVALFNSVVERLIVRAREGGMSVEWSQRERDLVQFSAAVLSRLAEEPGALTRLIELTGLIGDQELAAVLGVALCNTRRPEVYIELHKVQLRFGRTSIVWRRIQPYIRKVPEPKLIAAAGTSTSDFLRSRVLMRMEQKRWPEALKDCQTLEGRGQLTRQDVLRYAIVLKGLGRKREALLRYNRAIEMGDPSANLHMMRATVLADLGETTKALADLNRSIQLAPDPGTFYNRALLYIRIGKPELALRDLDRAMEMKGAPLAMIHRMRGRALFDLGRYSQGAQALDQSLKLEPNQPNALTMRGRARLRLGQLARAMDDVERALKLNPGHVAALCARARIRLESGALEAARDDAIRALKMRPTDTYALMLRALVYAASNEFDQALPLLDKALKHSKTRAEKFRALASRADMLRKAGRVEEALRDFDRAVEMSPKAYEARANRSIARYAAQDLAGALADAKLAVELAPGYGIAHLNYGQLLFGARKYKESLEQLEQAAHLMPRNADAFHYRGLVKRQTGDVKGALADYGKALEIDPRRLATLVNRADLLYRARRYAPAKADFVKATRLAPELWQAWAGLGQTLLALGDKPAAAEALRRAIAGAPQQHQATLRAALEAAGG